MVRPLRKKHLRHILDTPKDAAGNAPDMRFLRRYKRRFGLKDALAPRRNELAAAERKALTTRRRAEQEAMDTDAVAGILVRHIGPDNPTSMERIGKATGMSAWRVEQIIKKPGAFPFVVARTKRGVYIDDGSKRTPKAKRIRRHCKTRLGLSEAGKRLWALVEPHTSRADRARRPALAAALGIQPRSVSRLVIRERAELEALGFTVLRGVNDGYWNGSKDHATQD